MQDQVTRAGLMTAIAHGGTLTALPFTLAALAREEAHSRIAEAVCDLGEKAMRPKLRTQGRLARFARSAAVVLLVAAITQAQFDAYWRRRLAHTERSHRDMIKRARASRRGQKAGAR